MSHAIHPDGAPPTSDVEKPFVCTAENCGKSFARREHLRRHEFNHRDSDFTCHRCSVHFRRRDLLERHTQRHRQKDEEAGGEGLGHLATRKRLWKDGDGKVVSCSRRRLTPSVPSQLDQPNRARNHNLNHDGSPTFLRAESNSDFTEQYTDHRQGQGVVDLQDQSPFVDPVIMPQNAGLDLDFLSTSNWTDQSLEHVASGPCDLPDHDISYPDTTIFFNATLPTSNYYSWLFGKDLSYDNTSHNLQSLSSLPESPAENYISAQSSQLGQNIELGSVGPSSRATPLDDRRLSSAAPVPRHETRTKIANTQNGSSIALQVDNNFPIPTPSSMRSGTANLSPTSRHHGISNLGMNSLDCTSLYFSPAPQPHKALDTPGSSYASTCAPPDTYTPSSNAKLPIMTNEARKGLLQIISQCHPMTPAGLEVTTHDPLLSLRSLQRYSDEFFIRFNTTYPLIHQATFNSSAANPLQLMSLVLLGATYCDERSHALAVCIHDIMRPLIHSSKEFGTKPKLWMLQTILLVECFGKTRAGEKQHDMSNLYHGLQINLLRRSDCLTAYVPTWDERSQTLEEYWRLSIEAEEKRRLALISFMWDTQHALLFAQILCMNASEIKVTLPWDPAIWAAESAEEWHNLTQMSPAAPQFLTVLQMYTDSSLSCAPLHLNVLSRIIVFHGLMSLSWDFRRREQTALYRNSTSSAFRWQSKISACYTKWKVDFEQYTGDVLAAIPMATCEYAKFQRYTVANTAVYHIAQIILEIEPADLQIHAGAKHIMGRALNGIDRQRSQARVNELVERDGGESISKATWHAARLLRDGVRKLDDWNADEIIHFPWCLYLATLACWTLYEIAGENDGKSQPSLLTPVSASHAETDEEEDDWDSRTDMKALISALARLDPCSENFTQSAWAVAAKYKPSGLLTCMTKHLRTIRWAIIRESVNVLGGLENT